MISILCPSRGRPDLARRMIDTIYKTVSQHSNIEILLYLNDDDTTLKQYKKYIDQRHYIIGSNQSTCFSWNQLAEKAKYDILFLAGDDIQFMTKNWDLNIIKVFEKFPDKICMAAPFDGNTKGNGNALLINEEPYQLKENERVGSPHFAVHRNWMKALGYFVPPFFWHWYVDTYNQTVAKKLGRCFYLTKTLIQAKKVFDDTAILVRQNLNINIRDDYVWNKVKDRHLDTDVKKLQEFIANYKD
jgi:hypothetical protein